MFTVEIHLFVERPPCERISSLGISCYIHEPFVLRAAPDVGVRGSSAMLSRELARRPSWKFCNEMGGGSGFLVVAKLLCEEGPRTRQ